MKCYVGIDLGSTTTKAVVLDDNRQVLGRGITNSRSDYSVACSVARNEAFTNVRFTLCGRALSSTDLPVERRHEFLDVLERAFRLAQHRAHLEVLRTEMTAEIGAVERFFPGVKLQGPVGAILDEMEAEAAALFAPDAPRRSDFFRDIAGSQYHKLTQKRACPEKLPFEALMAVFDKAILKVENRQIDLSFEQGAGQAIDAALRDTKLADSPLAGPIHGRLASAFEKKLRVIEEVGTGYGRARLPFAREQIRSEILCHGLGAHAMFPDTATVLDIGGQDTKAIQVDGQGIVTSFQMNDRCAAGCGRYLGYIADEMSLGLHELGPLAQKSCRPVRINSTCTVFAGAEIRDRLTLGQKREDILAGLHRAVILRAMSLLARSGGVRDQFTFTGGVAKNVTAVAVLRDLVSRNFGELTINISPDSIYTGALGAALFAQRQGEGDGRQEAAA
jgi:benzoyl-CoA reductase subunit A